MTEIDLVVVQARPEGEIADQMQTLLDFVMERVMHAGDNLQPTVLLVTPDELIVVGCTKIDVDWIDVSVERALDLATTKAAVCMAVVPVHRLNAPAQDFYVCGADGRATAIGAIPAVHMAATPDWMDPEDVCKAAKYLWGNAWVGQTWRPIQSEHLDE